MDTRPIRAGGLVVGGQFTLPLRSAVLSGTGKVAVSLLSAPSI